MILSSEKPDRWFDAKVHGCQSKKEYGTIVAFIQGLQDVVGKYIFASIRILAHIPEINPELEIINPVPTWSGPVQLHDTISGL